MNYFDFKIENCDFHCEDPFLVMDDVFEYIKHIGASHIRQSYRHYPQAFREVVGEFGEWMDLATFESAVYEYNHTRI
jgi:hypothetical protein